MQNLTTEQIELLYNFTRKHYVEYYDVQTELVDHLANGIETQFEENSGLTFNEALSREFKKFGVFGFSEIVDTQTYVLEKRYRKEVFICLKNYFKLPKIIITILSISLVFKFFSLFENKDNPISIILVLAFLSVVYYTIKESRFIKNKQIITGKKWLFEQVNSSFGGFIHFFNIGVYIPLFSNFDRSWNDFSLLVFSICLVMYVLLFYVSIKVVSPSLREKFSKENPEYKFS